MFGGYVVLSDTGSVGENVTGPDLAPSKITEAVLDGVGLVGDVATSYGKVTEVTKAFDIPGVMGTTGCSRSLVTSDLTVPVMGSEIPVPSLPSCRTSCT